MCHHVGMRTRLPRKPVAISVIALAVGSLALVGCSPSDAAVTTPQASASTAVPDDAQQVEFEAGLSSASSTTYQVGKADSQVFGVNILEGNTTINGESVKVQILGTVNYESGSGPFGSFLALQWPDGTVLGLELDGQATKDAESGATDFTAQLQVINGSGEAEGITGGGDFTGSRTGPLATEITIKVKLDLVDAPETITGS